MQEKFCIAYAVLGNGEQAAIEAGYTERSARVTASNLLTNTNIRERINELLRTNAAAKGVTLQQVIEEYARIAFCDLAEFITVDEGGLVIPKPQNEMPKNWGRSVRKLKTKRAIREAADGSSVLVYDDMEIELWPKTDALEKLGKYLGMFAENRNPESVTVDKLREALQSMADNS